MRWPRGSRGRDAAAAVVLIVVATAALGIAWSFPARAAGWPIAIWSLLIVFSLVLLVGSFKDGGDERSDA